MQHVSAGNYKISVRVPDKEYDFVGIVVSGSSLVRDIVREIYGILGISIEVDIKDCRLVCNSVVGYGEVGNTTMKLYLPESYRVHDLSALGANEFEFIYKH